MPARCASARSTCCATRTRCGERSAICPRISASIQKSRRLFRRHAAAVRDRSGAPRQSAPHHRRRTDRGPRPRGTRPLPQSARRDRRKRHRDPVDEHRLGRFGPLRADGDHSPGPGVAERGPLGLTRGLEGRVWQKAIARSELDAAKAAYPVISTPLVAGRTLVNVVGDSPPGEGFASIEATLEDVYFAAIAGRLHDSPAAQTTAWRRTCSPSRRSNSERGRSASRQGSISRSSSRRRCCGSPPPADRSRAPL